MGGGKNIEMYLPIFASLTKLEKLPFSDHGV